MYDKSQATIEQILNAAQRSFVANNYNDITMTAIAQEANMTKGAIYHHFKSKEDLFLQMMVRYLEGLQDLLRPAVKFSGNARERLAKLTTLYLEQSLEEQLAVQLVRRDANRFSKKSRQNLIKAYQNALPNQIETIIADGMAKGEIVNGDARLLAWQFIAIVEVYLHEYARQKFDSPQAMSSRLAALFIDGVGNQSKELEGRNNGKNVH